MNDPYRRQASMPMPPVASPINLHCEGIDKV